MFYDYIKSQKSNFQEIKKYKKSFDKLNEYFDKSYLKVNEILACDKLKYYP